MVFVEVVAELEGPLEVITALQDDTMTFSPDDRLHHVPSLLRAAAGDERSCGIEEIAFESASASADEGAPRVSFPLGESEKHPHDPLCGAEARAGQRRPTHGRTARLATVLDKPRGLRSLGEEFGVESGVATKEAEYNDALDRGGTGIQRLGGHAQVQRILRTSGEFL